MTSAPIVVVGASMAGLRACEQLRAAGWDGALTVVGAEPHMPYNRPPLSKQTGPAPGSAADWLSTVEFRRRASLNDVTWILGTAAEHADLAAHTVTLADGRHLDYSGLVIATGLRPRRITGDITAGTRHVLRTIDDAAALYPKLAPGRRVVVIGGGFIGCEIAVTAQKHGCQVTIVEPQPAPMAAALGSDLGSAIGELHRDAGVEIRNGVHVTRLTTAGDGAKVTLSDGSTLDADVIVESVGSHPNVEWLDGNGLDLTDGVLTDEHLAAVGADDVIAVGDVARFPNPRFDIPARRVEHWCIPTDSAKHGVRTLLSQLTGSALPDAPFAPLPSFWSDQGDIRIQGYGIPAIADDIEVLSGELTADGLRAGVVIGYRSGSRQVAVVAVNTPADQQTRYRTDLARATDPTPLPSGATA
jgi:3-phenylpropionate/trans-cinnamate dioxygenase ferredoxin reductase subunit